MTKTPAMKQMMDQTIIDALTLDVPTGSHDHEIDEGGAQTRLGGMHQHVFRVPGGDYLITDISGGHEHSVYPAYQEADELYTGTCGEHVHTVTLSDGTVLKTEIDGWHSHCFHLKTDQTDPEETSEPQGQHRHRLVLPNGVVLMSSMPGDDLEVLSREAGNAAFRANMAKGYPQSPTAKGTAEIVVKDNKPGVRLTLGFDDSHYVVDLDVARKGAEVDSAEAAAHGFGLSGYRYMRPLLGELHKARVSKRATRVDTTKNLDDLEVTWGLQTETLKEAFLTGSIFTGVLVLRKGSAGWSAELSRTATPQVLAKGAPLPPPGYSALPLSLQKACPPELSFWTAKVSELAKQQRDTLAVSRYFDAENLAQVGGPLHKVERRTSVHLYDPKAARAELRTYAGEVRKLLPETAKPVVLKGDAWAEAVCPEGGVLVIEADDAAAVAGLAKTDDPFLVIAEDTAANRRALAGLGQVFKVDHPEAETRVFVASYDLGLAKCSEAVVPVAEMAAPEVKVLTTNVDKALAVASGGQYRRVLAKAADDSDERFVLGVVLEPDTVDAQQDIYDAPTIRKAAHLYMERYQNMGLQHKELVNDRVILLESYIAPVDMTIGGQAVKAGSWVMGVRFDDAELWKGVKSGKITGFSIGGYATRTEEPATPAEKDAGPNAEPVSETPSV